MRRNKDEMEQMRGVVNSYLLANNNDPQKAYNDYIKYFLCNNISLPYYIKGLKDFIKLSEDKKHNEYILLNEIKKEKELNIVKEEYKIGFKNFLNNMPINEIKSLWKNNKTNMTEHEKSTFIYFYTTKSNNEFRYEDFNNNEIMTLRSIFNQY